MQLQRALPNWDEIRAEKRKRQRAQAEEENLNRKRAKVEVPEKAPDPLAEYSDDEDEGDTPMEVDKGEAPLDEVEQAVFKGLKHENVVEIVVASLVS